MNEICLLEIRNPAVRRFIERYGKTKISRDHELIFEIKDKF